MSMSISRTNQCSTEKPVEEKGRPNTVAWIALHFRPSLSRFFVFCSAGRSGENQKHLLITEKT